MQIKNREDLLRPVFDLIKKHAPNTYEAMEAAYWPVTLVMDGRDFDEIARKIPNRAVQVLANRLSEGLGCTCQPGGPIDALTHTTWLNASTLAIQALENGNDLEKLAATVTVHEWTHRRGYGEAEAYREGAKFARAMGEEAIAQSHERTWVNLQKKEHEQQQQLEFLRRIGVPV